MCCWLDLANRLHESISDDYANIGPRVSIGFLAQGDEVGLCETVGCGAQVELEHGRSGVLLGQWNVNSLLKSVGVPTVYGQHIEKTVGNFHLDSNKYRLLMAESRVHGMFVAPRTSTPSLSIPTPADRTLAFYWWSSCRTKPYCSVEDGCMSK